MAQKQIKTEGIVLLTDTAGEHFLRIHLFTPDHGLLLCLLRESTARKNGSTPDLFDRSEFNLEKARQTDTWFVKDCLTRDKYTGLSRSYGTLLVASRLSRILLANLTHLESFDTLYDLLLNALQAWDAGKNPELVFLKVLFKWLRDEGLPLKEHWLDELPREMRQRAIELIRNPIPEEPDDGELIKSILKNLEIWIRHYTDVIIPM